MDQSDSKSLKLGVIGDPVAHSLSPQIHRQFARQLNHSIDYQRYQLNSLELSGFIARFFAQSGTGLNITLPYKTRVIELVDLLTEEAKITQSVNTLYLNQDRQLVGATTDGRGLLIDLERQNFAFAQKNILIIGAGGAAQSIIAALIHAGASVSVLNRTQSKVDLLAQQFDSIGEIRSFEPNSIYHGAISCISEFNSALIKPVANCIESGGYFYDLNYASRADKLRAYVQRDDRFRFADGMGMLVNQAALSYQLWTGKLPDACLVELI